MVTSDSSARSVYSADHSQRVERRQLALELLGEVRRTDTDLIELKTRITRSVKHAVTTVTDVVGVGPIMAAYLIGYSGDVTRLPTAGHYARHNGTTPRPSRPVTTDPDCTRPGSAHATESA